MPFLNLIGQRFGRLIVTEKLKSKNYKSIYLCKCDCGKTLERFSKYLINGDTKSCGCLKKEIKHGLTGTSLYMVWASMIQRCHNPKDKGYKGYGKRGIIVCERWRYNFENFLEDMGNRPTGKHSIDRINNDGNYEPSNCRWATSTIQNKNKRLRKDARLIQFNNKVQPLAEWARELNIKRRTLGMRLDNYGWSIEKSFTTNERRIFPSLSA